MARDTLQLFAGIALSVAIVAGVSATARMFKGAAVEAAPSPFVVACVD